MKKWNAIGILIILVTGMVFICGCTSSDATSTVPVETPALQTGNDTVPVTPTPAPTPQPVTTPSVIIPSSGVWVKVTYSGNFSGSYGTPGVLKAVEDRGDSIYQIPTNDGPVVVTFQKSDGSSAKLSVDVYKDGTLIKHAATTAPKGLVEFEAPLEKVTTSATTVPATTAPATTTLQPVIPLPDVEHPGTLSIFTNGGLGNDVIVYIAREGSSVQPINTDPYVNSVGNPNPGYLQVKILPNGESLTVSLVPGNYIAYLPAKGGGEPERQQFTINANCNTVVSFTAYSYRASSGGGGCGG